MTVRELETLLTDAPDLPAYWVQLARALDSAGRTEEAADAWRMALRLVPNSPPIQEAVNELRSPSAADDDEPLEPVRSDRREDPFDLDALIADLQSGVARKAEEDGKPASPAIGSEPNEDDLATETLARIYEAQGHLTEASRVYEMLADRTEDPHEAAALRAEADDLRRRASGR